MMGILVSSILNCHCIDENVFFFFFKNKIFYYFNIYNDDSRNNLVFVTIKCHAISGGPNGDGGNGGSDTACNNSR